MPLLAPPRKKHSADLAWQAPCCQTWQGQGAKGTLRFLEQKTATGRTGLYKRRMERSHGELQDSMLLPRQWYTPLGNTNLETTSKELCPELVQNEIMRRLVGSRAFPEGVTHNFAQRGA